MAVSAIILEPQNEFEQHFSIPVATQNFFERFWIPAIESINTEWIAGIRYGIDVTKEDAVFLIHELSLLKDWVRINLQGDVQEKILSRIDLFETTLPTAFQRGDAVVFIG
ncbi:hypothetical protein PAECIP111893_02095 [Paenibacillus plantiphilus]|uniref:Uncharacterized protein n=1 Tax=Paenibacillus plantiphilus TaxID=2905650 RepID=A0ABN8GFB5_9BACL|nr:hypothetical protein [Paenibacillus plantiphilus]CAH1203865.1 hypothetical protein PAECIP111893_02095 [Paenibacillus plantiphilus]